MANTPPPNELSVFVSKSSAHPLALNITSAPKRSKSIASSKVDSPHTTGPRGSSLSGSRPLTSMSKSSCNPCPVAQRSSLPRPTSAFANRSLSRTTPRIQYDPSPGKLTTTSVEVVTGTPTPQDEADLQADPSPHTKSVHVDAIARLQKQVTKPEKHTNDDNDATPRAISPSNAQLNNNPKTATEPGKTGLSTDPSLDDSNITPGIIVPAQPEREMKLLQENLRTSAHIQHWLSRTPTPREPVAMTTLPTSNPEPMSSIADPTRSVTQDAADITDTPAVTFENPAVGVFYAGTMTHANDNPLGRDVHCPKRINKVISLTEGEVQVAREKTEDATGLRQQLELNSVPETPRKKKRDWLKKAWKKFKGRKGSGEAGGS